MLYYLRLARMYKEKYWNTTPSITVDTLYQSTTDTPGNSIPGNTLLLDVRTQEEIAEGFIVKNAPTLQTQHATNTLFCDYFSQDLLPFLDTLDPTQYYCVYCRAGVRSLGAAYYMRKKGFSHVYNLIGGIEAWKEKKYPIYTI